MNFTQWVSAEKGRAARLAQRFGVTASAVTQWSANGVPIEKMQAVCEESAGEVSIEALVAETAALKRSKSTAKADA